MDSNPYIPMQTRLNNLHPICSRLNLDGNQDPRTSMLRSLIPALLLAAQFLLSPHPSGAQSSTAASACPCALRGSVVDSVSGQPVSHALVKISPALLPAVLTDSAGNFQFENVPAGFVTLEARKPGFLANDGYSSWYAARAISFQFGPGGPPATVKLIPESVIFGQLTDENGQPLEGIAISVFFRSFHGGRLYQDQHLHAVTDDEGRFRIAGLHRGSYYLFARPEQPPAVIPARKSAAPSGYPPVFYPGAGDPATAEPIKVLPGNVVQANFSLKRESFVQLSGTISGFTPQVPVSLTLWDSSGTPVNAEVVFDSATGAFHTKWIPPGAYTLTAQSPLLVSAEGGADSSVVVRSFGYEAIHISRNPLFARLPINATSSISDLHLTLQPTANIPVVLQGLPGIGSENPLSQFLQLSLVSRETGLTASTHFASLAHPESAGSSGEMELLFLGVAPGKYELHIELQPNTSYYAESATWGSADLLRDDLVLDSSGLAPPIDVAVRNDAASLNGSVSAPDPSMSALVVVLGNNRSSTKLLSVTAGGTFNVPALAPGTYRVFAVDSSANFDYQDPAFLAKISSKIHEITLTPKQSATVNLDLAAVEE